MLGGKLLKKEYKEFYMPKGGIVYGINERISGFCLRAAIGA